MFARHGLVQKQFSREHVLLHCKHMCSNKSNCWRCSWISCCEFIISASGIIPHKIEIKTLTACLVTVRGKQDHLLISGCGVRAP